MSMGNEWAARGSEPYERALILAGLGQPAWRIELALRSLFPTELAVDLAAAAYTAVANHQRAIAAVTPAVHAALQGEGAAHPEAIPLGGRRVDITFTYTHPGTGEPRHGFIRCDLPPDATTDDVRDCVSSFIADMIRQYGDRYVPAFGDVNVSASS